MCCCLVHRAPFTLLLLKLYAIVEAILPILYYGLIGKKRALPLHKFLETMQAVIEFTFTEIVSYSL